MCVYIYIHFARRYNYLEWMKIDYLLENKYSTIHNKVVKNFFFPTLKNECELKRFKYCVVYSRVRHFWIYTTVSFFKKPSPPLPMCVLKILSILKKKKKKVFKNTMFIPQCHLKINFDKKKLIIYNYVIKKITRRSLINSTQFI